MDLLQDIKTLDVAIIKQKYHLRTTQNKLIIAHVKKHSGYIIIIVGIGISSYSNAIVPIIGLILEAFATIEANKTSKILKDMEQNLIELQTRRSALWVEMMAKE